MAKYICTGTCGGSVTEEEYNAGKHVCGTEGCAHEGQPFERVEDGEASSSDDTQE